MEASRAVKGVTFCYKPTLQTQELLAIFRDMVNHAIHICLTENIKGRLRLRNRIYKEFQERYRVVSCYPYCVAEVAWSIVKKHRHWQRRPSAKHLMMKMDAANYSLNYSVLSLPFKKGERVMIPLEYGDYQRSFLMDKTLKRGSVTLTDTSIIIAFSKESVIPEPSRRVGIDLNEKSVVCSDGTRYDLSEVSRLHNEYGIRRAGFYRRHSDDNRLKKKFASSRREKERVKQFLNRISKQIIQKAKANREAIVLERLKGIRLSHRRGNGEGSSTRRRIALWSFGTFQRMIQYKAASEGVPLEYVGAAYTSRTCSKCGYINRKLKLTEREWRCPDCGCQLDRDLNAAINIERRGKLGCLGVVRSGARDTDEAMKEVALGQQIEGNPLAEVPKSSQNSTELYLIFGEQEGLAESIKQSA